MEHAAAELEKSGAAELILTYDPDAFGFYQKLGFRTCGETRMYQVDWLCQELPLK